MTLPIIFFTLQLFCANLAPEPELIGTWYAIDEGEVITATFNADSTFTLNAQGLAERIKQLMAMGMEVNSIYSCTPGDPNRIQLLYKISYQGKTREMVMNGIYAFPDAATLRLDFRPDTVPQLEAFSPQAMTFTNDLNALASMLPEPDNSGNYIFSYEREGEIVRDTITPNHRTFYGIDSLYRQLVEQD
jgi:hypothetical protein